MSAGRTGNLVAGRFRLRLTDSGLTATVVSIARRTPIPWRELMKAGLPGLARPLGGSMSSLLPGTLRRSRGMGWAPIPGNPRSTSRSSGKAWA